MGCAKFHIDENCAPHFASTREGDSWIPHDFSVRIVGSSQKGLGSKFLFCFLSQFLHAAAAARHTLTAAERAPTTRPTLFPPLTMPVGFAYRHHKPAIGMEWNQNGINKVRLLFVYTYTNVFFSLLPPTCVRVWVVASLPYMFRIRNDGEIG